LERARIFASISSDLVKWAGKVRWGLSRNVFDRAGECRDCVRTLAAWSPRINSQWTGRSRPTADYLPVKSAERDDRYIDRFYKRHSDRRRATKRTDDAWR